MDPALRWIPLLEGKYYASEKGDLYSKHSKKVLDPSSAKGRKIDGISCTRRHLIEKYFPEKVETTPVVDNVTWKELKVEGMKHRRLLSKKG